MKLKFIETKANCPIAVIDNFFSSNEVIDIKKELGSIYAALVENDIKHSQQYAGVATDCNSNDLRKSKSIFVDNFFLNRREESKILLINRKIFADKFLLESLISKSFFYKHIENSNKDWVLANFYSDGDNYKTHTDGSCFTLITFFKIKKFTGGELVFTDFDISIEPTENRCVIFPGFLKHKANEVKSGVKASLAHFINYM